MLYGVVYKSSHLKLFLEGYNLLVIELYMGFPTMILHSDNVLKIMIIPRCFSILLLWWHYFHLKVVFLICFFTIMHWWIWKFERVYGILGLHFKNTYCICYCKCIIIFLYTVPGRYFSDLLWVLQDDVSNDHSICCSTSKSRVTHKWYQLAFSTPQPSKKSLGWSVSTPTCAVVEFTLRCLLPAR